MFHQDELVRNYLEQALQRYSDLRIQNHRQSDELERFLSPKPRANETEVASATQTMPVAQRLPTFERKNTLLLTGKSKFYTMSYEDHCQSPCPSNDQCAAATEHYGTLATDSLSGYVLEDRVNAVRVESCVNEDDAQKSRSVPESLQRGFATTSCVDPPIAVSSHKWPWPDRNHNSIFWPSRTQCLGAVDCPHPVLPNTGQLCAACFQARRYSSVVQYPTAVTKL